MKILKNTIIALSLIVLASFTIEAKANDNPEVKSSANITLAKYVEGTTKGKLKGFSELIDKDFKLGVVRGEKPVSFNKDQFLADIQHIDNVTQQCKTSYTLLESNAEFAVARVEMQYPNFTRVNCVNMTHTSEGWKITNISTTFK